MKTSKKILSRIGLLVVAVAVCAQLTGISPQSKLTSLKNTQFAELTTTKVVKSITADKTIMSWANNSIKK